MIVIDDKAKEAIGAGVLKIQAVESCCGYALESTVIKKLENSDSGVEVDGVKFSVDDFTRKIAPKIGVSVSDETPGALEIKNLAAKSYCGCGRSFAV